MIEPLQYLIEKKIFVHIIKNVVDLDSIFIYALDRRVFGLMKIYTDPHVIKSFFRI